MKERTSLTLDDTLKSWIDAERGNLARSAFINKILEQEYKRFKENFDWDFEEAEADKDIENGDTVEFKTSEEAIKWLKS